MQKRRNISRNMGRRVSCCHPEKSGRKEMRVTFRSRDDIGTEVADNLNSGTRRSVSQ
ncbi:hypothetical protein CEXT_521351, partial [Caerostris extrusa]